MADPGNTSSQRSGGGTSVRLAWLAKRGDPRALDALFAREMPLLRRWAHGRLPDWARGVSDTVDLVQDVMLNTFRRFDTFEMRHRGALQAYLRRAIQNRIRDEIRFSHRRPEGGPVDSATPDSTPSPLDVAADQEAIRLYTDGLAKLRPLDRELIVGRLELGYSYEKLALACDRPTAESARIAVRRALLRLADEMGP
jgi:RNA polymerase sigma-70 factor, ECF subfamily